MKVFGKLLGRDEEDPKIYSSKLYSLRHYIRKNNNEVKCYICGKASRVDFPAIESYIYNNSRKDFELRSLGAKTW